MNNYTIARGTVFGRSSYYHRPTGTNVFPDSQILVCALGNLSGLGASGTIIAAKTGGMLVGQCQLCKDFLEAAQTATKRHIDAQSKLRMANMRFEHEAVPMLESLVEEAARGREQALARLRDHA